MTKRLLLMRECCSANELVGNKTKTGKAIAWEIVGKLGLVERVVTEELPELLHLCKSDGLFFFLVCVSVFSIFCPCQSE